MSAEIPIACSLGAAELPERLAEMSALGKASLLGAEIDGSRALLSFRAAARDRLAVIVAAEAECCAFLSMKLDDGADAIHLAIEGPPRAEPAVQDLVAAFTSGGPMT